MWFEIDSPPSKNQIVTTTEYQFVKGKTSLTYILHYDYLKIVLNEYLFFPCQENISNK